MSTVRVARRQHFTVVDRRMVEDDRLSFRARGVLLWILDKPDDWRFDSDSIAEAGVEGRDAIRTAMKELQDAGYIRREKRQTDGGRWVTDVMVYETAGAWESVSGPSSTDVASEQVEPTPGFPAPGDPAPGTPGPLPKTGPSTETDETENTRALALALVDTGFEDFWKCYPRKLGKPKAELSYKAARKVASAETIAAGLDAWRTYWSEDATEQHFVPHPTTWLNQHRWDDVPPPRRQAERSRRDRQLDDLAGIVEGLPSSLFSEPQRAVGR